MLLSVKSEVILSVDVYICKIKYLIVLKKYDLILIVVHRSYQNHQQMI